jgi:hypothetical protein
MAPHSAQRAAGRSDNEGQVRERAHKNSHIHGSSYDIA